MTNPVHLRGGGMLQSLRDHVGWRVRQHQNQNETLRSLKYPCSESMLRALLGDGSIKLVLEYLGLLVLILIYEFLLDQRAFYFLPDWINNPSVVTRSIVGRSTTGQVQYMVYRDSADFKPK
ncbi:MAG: hypothetical protein SFW65_01255 [Alphaproteobacteria bacterium]|nr:hypothetical protein [Alphaproteobacteria bacterium]